MRDKGRGKKKLAELIELSAERDKDGRPLYDCVGCPDRVRVQRCCPKSLEKPERFPGHPRGPNTCPIVTVDPWAAAIVPLASGMWSLSPDSVDLKTFQAVNYVDACKGRLMREARSGN